MPRFYEQLPAVLAEGQPFALGIITATQGSSPQKRGAKALFFADGRMVGTLGGGCLEAATPGSSPQKRGAKALFFADGRMVGTLGGGCLEAEIQDRARRALQTQTPTTFELLLDHDFGWDDGLICGGSVSGLILPQAAQAVQIWHTLATGGAALTWGVRPDFTIGWADASPADWLYQATVKPPCGLWIAGSGHIAQAVAPLALEVDFAVTVFDDRPALANHHYFPAATRFRV